MTVDDRTLEDMNSMWMLDPYANIIHLEGAWIITNTRFGTQCYCSPPGSVLNSAMRPLRNGKLASISSLAAQLASEQGLSVDASSTCINTLIEARLITRATDLDQCSRDRPNEVLRYLALSESNIFSDYAEPNVHQRDRGYMENYLLESYPPTTMKEFISFDTYPLPHPAIDKINDHAGELAEALFWAFGRLRSGVFLGVMDVILKAVPSKGARHPFEVYVEASGLESIADGFYYYQSHSHRLQRIAEVKNNQCCLTIYITVVFERVQWRYRESWSYKDIFLDLGHVSETLMQVCGVRATLPTGRIPEALPVIPLEEELLACVDLVHYAPAID